MNLSQHFTLSEFLFSETALRLNIDNTPPAEVIETLKWTAQGLELVRSLTGSRLRVSSGYRCLELNRALRSKDTSQHVRGEAADVIPLDAPWTARSLCEKVAASNIQFDQLIYEYGSWMHISFTLTPRRSILTINHDGIFTGVI